MAPRINMTIVMDITMMSAPWPRSVLVLISSPHTWRICKRGRGQAIGSGVVRGCTRCPLDGNNEAERNTLNGVGWTGDSQVCAWRTTREEAGRQLGGGDRLWTSSVEDRVGEDG